MGVNLEQRVLDEKYLTREIGVGQACAFSAWYLTSNYISHSAPNWIAQLIPLFTDSALYSSVLMSAADFTGFNLGYFTYAYHNRKNSFNSKTEFATNLAKRSALMGVASFMIYHPCRIGLTYTFQKIGLSLDLAMTASFIPATLAFIYSTKGLTHLADKFKTIPVSNDKQP